MIFATVGSHPTFKFDRFLRLLDSLPGDDLIVQYGPGRSPINARHAMPWMPFEEVVEHMNSASHVVSHAGVGTILTAINAGHVPGCSPGCAASTRRSMTTSSSWRQRWRRPVEWWSSRRPTT